jgi:sulfite reductase (NADPH) flavoprotein alpha-component
MSGLGTGLAPFKAFLEEKYWQKVNGEEIGDIYLFLGSRHQRQEYLYGELFEAYKDAGILTYIGAAFSRDQPHKIYIQDRIREAKDRLIDAFVKKSGNFYLCGPTWPVPDISAALSDIVATEAASRGETVDPVRVIEDLKEGERYILEVY